MVAEMPTIRGIGHEHQACHPRFDHERISTFQIEHDPLPDAADGGDPPTSDPTGNRARGRGDLDRFEPTTTTTNRHERTTGDMRPDPTHHCLNLGQFRHVVPP